MDFLKNQWSRLQQQLGGLNATQKMLTATLVAIMVMTLVWWARYAGTPEMSPVLNQSLTPDELSRMDDALESKGIPHQVSGDKMLVPTDRRLAILGELGYAQLLPRNTAGAWDEMVKQMSPWDSPSQRDATYNHIKEVTLAQVIGAFPDVAGAQVIIDPTYERRVENSVLPSATVNITMRDGQKAPKALVDAAASIVAGVNAGLPKSRIQVIVDGVRCRTKDESEDSVAMGDDIIDMLRSHERHITDKINNQLQYIRGVIVSVTVDLNTKTVVDNIHKVDGVTQKEARTETNTEETTNSNPGGGADPGVAPNTQLSIPGASSGSGGSSTSTERSQVELTNFPSTTDTIVHTPAGDAKVVAASVRVPDTYFIDVYKRLNPGIAKDPDPATLQPLIDSELPKIRSAVKMCSGLRSDTDVSVETFIDTMPALATASAGSASSASAVTFAIGGHTKEIAVGALAVVSLFMVSMMVRKSTPAPIVMANVEAPGPVPLSAGEDVVGEAGEGSSSLDGMELDEETIRSQQMIDQVSTMVKDNPDAAANLVKRWLNRA